MTIKLDLKILLFVILFCFTSQLEMYLLLMIFAIIHEFGHLLVGMVLGFKPQEINITPVGMKIDFKPRYEEYNQKVGKGNVLAIKRGIVALAGPLTNFIIICIMEILINVSPQLNEKEICTTIIFANILIGIFNLIPIYPLDGGRITKEILHIIVGLQKSYTYTYKISKITIIILTILSSIFILYVRNISIIIILAYLWGLLLVQRKRYNTKLAHICLHNGKNMV